jgi:hypothetical protein
MSAAGLERPAPPARRGTAVLTVPLLNSVLELIEETEWTPERADQFRDALIAALKDQ